MQSQVIIDSPLLTNLQPAFCVTLCPPNLASKTKQKFLSPSSSRIFSTKMADNKKQNDGKEKKRKESILDLSKYLEKHIRVKFAGGREVSGEN